MFSRIKALALIFSSYVKFISLITSDNVFITIVQLNKSFCCRVVPLPSYSLSSLVFTLRVTPSAVGLNVSDEGLSRCKQPINKFFCLFFLLLSGTSIYSVLKNIEHDLRIYIPNLLYNIQI